MHNHEDGITSWFTILYIRKDCDLTLSGQLFSTFENDLILCRQNISYHTDTPQSITVFFYEQPFMDNLFDAQICDCRILYDFLHAEHVENEHLYFSRLPVEVLRFVQLLISEDGTDDIYHEKIIRLLTVGMFSWLDRTHYETLMITRSTMLQDHTFGKILKYISDHYRDVTLESTAKQFGYHPDYLSWRFRQITGVTFSKKLLSIRMEEAMHLLVTSQYTISEISDLVGYHDRSHFSRNFREYTGMTPKQYRKTYQIQV